MVGHGAVRSVEVRLRGFSNGEGGLNKTAFYMSETVLIQNIDAKKLTE